MNRISITLGWCFALLLLVFFPAGMFGQRNSNSGSLSQSDLESYLKQAEQLVKFTEFTFNTLGSAEASAREKDIIIHQSFLKFFNSDKVQIEDDLVEGRYTVTNKSVQAYLKDIDFFFKNVSFSFKIEDISYNVNDEGKIFFVATTTRTLRGISVEGDTVFNLRPRFIEINLDRDKRDLKIVSIYTNRLSEREDMRNWWAGLNNEWRRFFGQGIFINDHFQLEHILGFQNDRIIFQRFQTSLVDGFQMEFSSIDTILTEATPIYQQIRNIWQSTQIDISSYRFISTLEPLSKLTELKTINISGTHVDDLTFIRNLTRLESLNISETYITSLDPLRHAIHLKNLDAANTKISDLAPFQAYPALERLNLSGSEITDLAHLSTLALLRDLRINNTAIADLSPLAAGSQLEVLDISGTMVTSLDALRQLTRLERLHADDSKITDLSPLAGLINLQYLFIDRTQASNLEVLSGLPSLRRIFCDRTPVTREKAVRFMQDNPDVLVIWESQALTAWWAALSPSWRNIFREIVKLSEPPSREELHQIANITTLNLSGNREVFNLSPLQQLLGLRRLNISSTSVTSIEALRENIDLIELDISNLFLDNIDVVANFRQLEHLNMEHLPLNSIEILINNKQLKHLNIEHSNVASILPLASLANLELLKAEGINPVFDDIRAVYDANPGVTVIYQTEKLTRWWQDLPDEWADVFYEAAGFTGMPDGLRLQRLIDSRQLSISGKRNLRDITNLQKFHRLEVLRMNDIQISDISPLIHLTNLQELYMANNPIQKLDAIANLQKIRVLDCSNTLVRNLSPLKGLQQMEILNVSVTPVSSLRPLAGMYELRQLDCFNTRIKTLRPLENLQKLELLRCYNTRLWPWSLNRFKKALPDCEVIFY